MLKKNILTFCLLCVYQGFSKMQRFVYSTIYKPDSLKTIVVTESNVLDVVGQNSVYYNLNRAPTDADKASREQGGKDEASHAYLTYYMFKEKGKIEFFAYKVENAYQYEEQEKIIWQLKDSIVDYKGLYQALLADTDFGGRKWLFFFTTKIPISHGPYKFGALPGLIVKAQSTDLDYTKELLEVQQVKSSPIERLDNVLTLSKSKYLSLMNEHIKDPSKDMKNIFARYGIGMSQDVTTNGVLMKPVELFKKTNEKFWDCMKTHNNPLEKRDVWLVCTPMKIVLPE